MDIVDFKPQHTSAVRPLHRWFYGFKPRPGIAFSCNLYYIYTLVVNDGLCIKPIYMIYIYISPTFANIFIIYVLYVLLLFAKIIYDTYSPKFAVSTLDWVPKIERSPSWTLLNDPINRFFEWWWVHEAAFIWVLIQFLVD